MLRVRRYNGAGGPPDTDAGLSVHRIARIHAAARFCAVLAGLLAAIALIGYVFDLPLLVHVRLGLKGMSPLTATALLVLAIAAFASTYGHRPIARAGSIVAAAAGASVLASHVTFGSDIISPWVGRAVFHMQPGITSHMSDATALGVLLAASALILRRRTAGGADMSAGISLLFSGMALLGYFYGVSDLYALPMFNDMALNTAAALFLLSMAALLAEPEHGRAGMIASEGMGGGAIRRQLPILLLPAVAGWVLLTATDAKSFGPAIAMALLVIVTVVPLAILVLRDAHVLNALDFERREKSSVQEKLASELAQQIIAREFFARALAHDLKEPVRSVSWLSAIIADRAISQEDFDGYIRRIQDAGARMGLLVDSVLSYVQLDAPGEPARVTFELDAAVKAAEANLFALFQDRGVALSVASLPEVAGNQVQVIQLLQNLLSNAANHCEPPVKISIRTSREGGMVRVFVQDNGPGIAPERRQQIFEPFRRFNRDNQHTGLGLAICHKIVEAHGGQISCDSTLGQGSCFAFSLPAAPEKHAKPGEMVLAPVANGRIANVLWIDDRKDDLEMGCAMLASKRGMKCNIKVAYDGREGIDLIRARLLSDDPVDLVLLDINMPVMDGFETLELLKHDSGLASIPVVMCSGSSWEKDKERARALGAAGYVNKPPILERLRPIIDTIHSIRLVQEEVGQPVLVRLA